jgi:hypothetical protein
VMVMRAMSSIRPARDHPSAPPLLPSWLPFTLRGWAWCHPTTNYRGTDRPIKTGTLAMTDANATEAQIDTDAHETMTGTRGHDRAAEVRVGGGNHEHVVQARNIRHTVAQNHLLLHGTGNGQGTALATSSGLWFWIRWRGADYLERCAFRVCTLIT